MNACQPTNGHGCTTQFSKVGVASTMKKFSEELQKILSLHIFTAHWSQSLLFTDFMMADITSKLK